MTTGNPQEADLPAIQTSNSQQHKGNTQRDGGEDSGGQTAFDAPVDPRTQQTQTFAVTQVQGDGREPGLPKISASPLVSSSPSSVSSTKSDADHTRSTSISFLTPTLDGMPDTRSSVPTRTTMSTSITPSTTKEELKGTVSPETVLVEAEPSRKIPVFFPLDTASPTATSITPTLAIVSLPTSTPTSHSDSNGTVADVTPEGKSPTVSIAYAAIAPAVFVIFVLAAIFVRRKQKRKRTLEAEGNPRSEGVLSGNGEGSMGTGGVPIIAIPVPPSKRGGGRSRSNTLGIDYGKGIELQPLTPSANLASSAIHERARRENERELRDSDIYSPRYGTPSNHTSASSAQAQDRAPMSRVGVLPSVPSIELEDPDSQHIYQQTPPPTLPPLPSPDLNENWLPSRMGSPVQSSPRDARASPRYPSSPARASPPRTPPEHSSPLNAGDLKASPPIRGPAIASGSSNNLRATPFHKNYKRTSDTSSQSSHRP